MTALVWDQVGERFFESGVDRAVLFMSDGRAIAWNGLTGVDDATTDDVQSYYMDGRKFLERHIAGDYQGTLSAYTYPDEFNEVLGSPEVKEGLRYHGQKKTPFNLIYRTRVGNDVDGVEHGYKIHLLFNLFAVTNSQSLSSVGASTDPTEFSWTLTSVPSALVGFAPTTHLTIDSRTTDPDRLFAIEKLLYGSDTNEPTLPPIDIFTDLFEKYNALIVIDNGDGTWVAADLAGNYISMLDSETFQIVGSDATFLDADTYTISTTIP